MYSNILIPVILNNPEKTDIAFEAARTLADEGAHFTLLHVIESIPVYVSDYIPTDFMTEARDTVKTKLKDLAKTLPNCHAATTEGRPGSEILSWAEKNQFRLHRYRIPSTGVLRHFVGIGRASCRAPCEMCGTRDTLIC